MTQAQTNALALCGVKENPNAITQALVGLNEIGPVVAPGGVLECSGLAEGHKAIITKVTPGDSDVYVEKSSKKRCYTAEFLKVLAAGIGIEWDANKTRRLDNFSHPFICSVVVGGRYRDYTGAWREISGDAMLDLRDDAEHGINSAAELRRMRKKIQEHTITRAKSRAIADACVKRTQSSAAIGLPMFMCKVYPADATDEQVATANDALYGGETIDESTGEIHDVEHEVRDAAPPQSFADKCRAASNEQLESLRQRAQAAIDAGVADGADDETVERAKAASDAMDTIIVEMERRETESPSGSTPW